MKTIFIFISILILASSCLLFNKKTRCFNELQQVFTSDIDTTYELIQKESATHSTGFNKWEFVIEKHVIDVDEFCNLIYINDTISKTIIW